MLVRLCLSIAVLLLVAGAVSVADAAAPPARVDLARRAQRLARGINLSHWFAQVYDPRGYTPAHFDTHTTGEDLDLIRDLGFSFVRLSLEPKPLIRADVPGGLNADYLRLVDRGVREILDRDLAVIIDIHADPSFNKALATDPGRVTAFKQFWAALARHLAPLDPDRVFLEVLNEPVMPADQWVPMQQRLVAAIRAAAPANTIIVTGGMWSNIEDLLKLEPLPDRNVIYNFHFYEPGLFTHQGAGWGWHTWKYAAGTPYPLTNESIQALLPRIDYQATRDDLLQQAKKGWDAQRISDEIGKAARWAQQHDVRLLCDEFGVYRQFVQPGHRVAWIRDVRLAFEKHNIGWCMWDYQGGFALVRKVDGQPVPDPATVQALGLKPQHESSPNPR